MMAGVYETAAFPGGHSGQLSSTLMEHQAQVRNLHRMDQLFVLLFLFPNFSSFLEYFLYPKWQNKDTQTHVTKSWMEHSVSDTYTKSGADTTVLDLLGGSARQVAGKMLHAVLETLLQHYLWVWLRASSLQFEKMSPQSTDRKSVV